MEVKNIVVIGASAGGLKAVNQLVSNLPADLPAAVFIVIHMSKHSQAAVIVQHLQKLTANTCKVAENNETIKAGHIYLAPADQHLFLKPGKVRLLHGPHENRWRPSIDVLFRSAAAAYDSRVTGVVLSGLLDDGTSGMSAIKRSGGVCIVQEPSEAEYDDMPLNVIHNVDVDHRVLIQDMGYIIADVLSKPHHALHIPEDVKIEADITERLVSNIEDMQKLGTHSNFTCPDCGGGLWEIEKDVHKRYRCHTGHVYTALSLLEKQGEEMEESIWISVRMLEERRNLLLNMSFNDKGVAGSALVSDYQRRAEELAVHVDRLKKLLISISKTGPEDEGYL
ncbi:chemotaxis protein CheB [Mucilaginibacter phyllosphaerae]|uniref:protein-glutamate methylesterase n=1 Tax=Mucilaginibacter phyllosphaerae TaxID=1812349 RepID=A0A4Y8AIN0_9SPHI|nr:chemotaxis protein CheB [Mucilaginibacter phyllosphaerae]MBB3968049.1 two-component system chemotaxis response regulator CheB [Mucilaginibacter phyllosphaerae]TEW68928.1 chemotaxis protein CheB [Mucilaginibacter phyllosphaerae]GGH01563.1 protein-glutamate methylesterase [Mucilaginibacter phyllosphaerae]